MPARARNQALVTPTTPAAKTAIFMFFVLQRAGPL